MAKKSLGRLKELVLNDKTFSNIQTQKMDLESFKRQINTKLADMKKTRPLDPNSTTGSTSGTTCTGHVDVAPYNKATISYKELEEYSAALPKETCASVVATVCNCVDRVFLSPCDCQVRTTCTCNTVVGCTCNTRTVCDCDGRGTCDCNGDCRSRSVGCSCKSRCGCNARDVCSCVGRTALDCLARASVDCLARTTYTCSGRSSQPLCICQGRCSCNSEKRFVK